MHRFDYGLYGEDYLELRQACDSFLSSVGSYSSAIKRANCVAGSNSTSAIHKNEEIYGTLRTNGTITATPPFGGQTCADFTPNCPNKGETCAGDDCGVPLLDDFKPLAQYCPSTLPNPPATGGTLTIPANPESTNPPGNCWNTVTVNAGKTLMLTSVGSPYYIKTLNLANSAVLSISPSVANGTVEVYVETIVGDKFNGTQMVNTSGRPTQFILNYIGTNALLLNGNAAMNVALTAPFASVTVSGSFEYSGALLAKQTYLTGSGGFHYDESLGGSGPVTDAQFRLKDLIPYYR